MILVPLVLSLNIITVISAAVPPEGHVGDLLKPCNPEKDFSCDCQLKSAECNILDHILHGIDGSLMTKFLQCCDEMDIDISHEVLAVTYIRAKKTFLSPYDAMDSMITNLTALIQVRRCVLVSSKLLNGGGKLDRKYIAEQFQMHLFWTPRLQESLSKVTGTCPEPVNYDLRPFINCLKSVCLAEVPGMVDLFVMMMEDDQVINDIRKFMSVVASGFAF